jgi:thiol-disulfide isomerase/thioredoxin
MHTPWCTQVAKSEYTRTAQKIAAINNTLATSATYADNTSFGRPVIKTAYGASLYKAPSIKALDFLAKLKQSFPGKAIIIDRWATWCAPCLSEMPHSKDLELASKNLPVVFVYLCTLNESSEDKWKSKVIELQQPGVHVLINQALDADLSKYFSFSGYPGYAFIDKAGNYKPAAITRMFFIKDSEALAAIINN